MDINLFDPQKYSNYIRKINSFNPQKKYSNYIHKIIELDIVNSYPLHMLFGLHDYIIGIKANNDVSKFSIEFNGLNVDFNNNKPGEWMDIPIIPKLSHTMINIKIPDNNNQEFIFNLGVFTDSIFRRDIFRNCYDKYVITSSNDYIFISNWGGIIIIDNNNTPQPFEVLDEIQYRNKFNI